MKLDLFLPLISLVFDFANAMSPVPFDIRAFRIYGERCLPTPEPSHRRTWRALRLLLPSGGPAIDPTLQSSLKWYFRYPGCKEFCWLVRPTQMRVQIQRWREHKKDTLIGFFNIELSGQGLVIKGLALHQKADASGSSRSPTSSMNSGRTGTLALRRDGLTPVEVIKS